MYAPFRTPQESSSSPCHRVSLACHLSLGPAQLIQPNSAPTAALVHLLTYLFFVHALPFVDFPRGSTSLLHQPRSSSPTRLNGPLRINNSSIQQAPPTADDPDALRQSCLASHCPHSPWFSAAKVRFHCSQHRLCTKSCPGAGAYAHIHTDKSAHFP